MGKVKFAPMAGVAGALLLAMAMAPAPAPAASVDQVLAADNAGKELTPAPIIDDMAFLRRVTVDLIGRIPTDGEIQQAMGWPTGQRRAMIVDRLLKDERFADRWTVFYADMMRIRSNRTGGTQLLAWVHQSVEEGVPYDQMARQLIASNGKPGQNPAVGFILGDDADPMALAGATAQTFLGIRIACAQCHDHPFDEWTQKQFYGLAAYFGKTRRVQSRLNNSVYTTEVEQTSVLWPPERQKPPTRTAVEPAFPFALDKYDVTPQYIARYIAARAARARRQQQAAGGGAGGAAASQAPAGPDIDALLAQADDRVGLDGRKRGPAGLDVAAEARREVRQLKVEDDVYRASEMRAELAQLVTDPRNRYFSRSFVNRVWAELIGRGFVEPVDDMTGTLKPEHPKTLDYLADEFVASEFDLRTLLRTIVLSQTYQRGHLGADVPQTARRNAQRNFVAAPVRRMLGEVLYDSIVLAGHLEEAKWPQGANMRTITERVRVAVGPIEGGDGSAAPAPPATPAAAPGAPVGAKMAMANGQRAVPSGYDLEQAIELDFKAALSRKDDAPQLAMMRVMSKEEIEANRMLAAARERRANGRMRYETRYVERQVDDNPVYAVSATRMATPAPPAHFLRVFGQPARDDLGDHRKDDATMRQALMMLNGRITNEAARVGDLEPMHAMLTGPNADPNAAIAMAYREALTRQPSPTELSEARQILADAESPVQGMADLRWVLLNCHEFRFLP